MLLNLFLNQLKVIKTHLSLSTNLKTNACDYLVHEVQRIKHKNGQP